MAYDQAPPHAQQSCHIQLRLLELCSIYHEVVTKGMLMKIVPVLCVACKMCGLELGLHKAFTGLSLIERVW